MKKLSIFVWIFIAVMVKGQDPHFAHVDETALWVNPAYTGLFMGTFRGVVGYRDQWSGLGTPYRTYYLSADGVVKQSMGSQFSVGGYGVFDRPGLKSFKQTYGAMSASAHVKVGEGYLLGGGIMTGIFNMSFRPEDWSWPSQYDGMHYDGSLPSGEDLAGGSITRLDVGGGIAFYFMRNATNPFSNDGIRGKVGVSFYHINRPEQISVVGKDKKFSKVEVEGDVSIGIPNTNTAVQPGFLLGMQGPHVEFLPGVMVRYMLKEESKYTGYIKNSAMTLGSYVRVGDAVTAMLGFEFSSYMVGFSYDVNVSGLSKASKGNGAMEIFIRAIYPGPEKLKRGNSPML